MRRLLALATVMLTAGCATAPNTIQLMDGKDAVAREIHIDPVMFTGIPWTRDLKNGNFVAVMGTHPQTPEAYAEFDAMRISYPAHAVGADGKEYPAYALYAGYIGCLPRYTVIVEGLQERSADVKVLVLSTLLDRAYTLHGDHIAFNAAKFQSDASYRRAIVQHNGTPLDEARAMTGMMRAFRGWNVYQTKAGLIATPLDDARMDHLKKVNPQYSYWQKVEGTTRGAISPDFIATAVSLAFDLIIARDAKALGFDYESMVSRKQQGYNLAIMEAQRNEGAKNCIAAQERR